jgi:homoserine dehydrogenase
MDCRIVVCGVGRIGRTFLDLLVQKADLLRGRYGLSLAVTAAVDLGGAAVAPSGLSIPALLAHLADGGRVETMPGAGRPGATGPEILAAGLGDVLVETTPTNIVDGEPGLGHMRAALTHGMHVVTAAKGPLVLRHRELKAMAAAADRRILMSAATAAALPTLDVGLLCLAGSEVLEAEGILNGTTNYILTRMAEDGCPYAEALAEAQRMGVAEPDPSLDVEGRDTANKILLIANEVFGADLRLADIPVTGITGVTPGELAEARRAGQVVKLLGVVTRTPAGVTARVAPTRLPADHPLAAVRGTEKAVSYRSDTMDRVTVSGGKSNPLGAAAALLKDILRLTAVS